ncbi:MAG: pyrroline-5-carboxylate reductase [Candidatus Dormibacteria bacterium]
MSGASNQPPVAVAGLGNMGEAIARGLALVRDGAPLLLHSRRPEAAAGLAVELGARAVATERLTEAATIFCCSEPDDVVELLAALAATLSRDHVVVVIAPSAPVAALAALSGAQVARVIPNLATRSAVGSLPVDDSGLDSRARRRLETVIEGIGRLEPVGEATIRVASGLASSGPAVVAAFLQSWLRACGTGLEPADRVRMAGRTLEAVASLLAEGWELEQIIKGVALPGGPTRRLVDAVGDCDLDERLAKAVAANDAAAHAARQGWLAALARTEGP